MTQSTTDLTIAGRALIKGNFSFSAIEPFSLVFQYDSFLKVEGIADIGSQTRCRFVLTAQQAKELWSHPSKRSVPYLEAQDLYYNPEYVRVHPIDECSIITGVPRTENGTDPNGNSTKALIVDFVHFKTFATCKVWWVIPLVIVIILAIIGIALICYFYGRNKEKELSGFIPSPHNSLRLQESERLNLQYGSMSESGE